jgi:hypothetical protein
MTQEEAEDYRYGYQYVGIVNDKEVSVRKISNCDGWTDLDTGETYSNEPVEIFKVNKDSINTMKAPTRFKGKEFAKALELLHKDDEEENEPVSMNKSN